MVSRGPCIPLEQRVQLYNKVHQLHWQGLSYRQIIDRIQRDSGVQLYWSIISYWVRRRQEPLGNVNKFDAKPSPDLAYVIGARLGDACVYKRGRSYFIHMSVVDREFAMEMGRRLARLLHRKKSYRPRWERNSRRWRVRGCGILLYRILKQPLDKLRPLIEHCRECAAAFIRAFFDSEGSMSGRALKVYNTNKALLLYIQDLLQSQFLVEATGPRPTGPAPGERFRSANGKFYRAKKQCYYLYVRVSSLRRFRDYIGFTVKRKRQRLVKAIQK